jgi:hypothetical protein
MMPVNDHLGLIEDNAWERTRPGNTRPKTPEAHGNRAGFRRWSVTTYHRLGGRQVIEHVAQCGSERPYRSAANWRTIAGSVLSATCGSASCSPFSQRDIHVA